MKLTRLRLVGFKTFLDPAEIVITDGLTGIVGPNGCGKSNLVEALRWVMGESSHKALRAAEMDEVIFAGSGGRPARNTAEVTLFIDNRSGRAPPPFAGHDEIEVTRRIERDKGSAYRVNGREALAREVQLLFADASTGARSPALVRQGQIGEIINAKPEARRRVLEEAAGIAGLHARRHEAELKLRTAEQNLERVEDVVTALQVQVDGLKRQARQALRYRQLSAEIRRVEGALAARAHAAALRDRAAAVAAVDAARKLVAEHTAADLAAARAVGAAEAALPERRTLAAAAAAARERLRREGEEIDRDERAAAERGVALGRRAEQLAGDLAREEALAGDAGGSLARLDADEAALAEADHGAEAVETAAAERQARAISALAEAEAALAAATAALAERTARRAAAGRSRDDLAARVARLRAAREKIAADMAAARATAPGEEGVALGAAAEAGVAAVVIADAALLAAEAALGTARDQAAAADAPAAAAEAALRRLEVERETLAKVLRPAGAGGAVPVSAALRVARGYEAALAAALGDDLEASDDGAAPLHWRALADAPDGPPLPGGAESLAAHVDAPAVLGRRLAQVGIVARDAGAALQPALAQGQRLVSREGDLWRWDGYTALATAETPAARRLAQRARLAEIEDALDAARAAAAGRRAAAEAAHRAVAVAADAERAARDEVRRARLAADAARARLAEAERRGERRLAQLAALREQDARLAVEGDEADVALAALAAELAALPPPDDLAAARAAATDIAAAARAALADARAAVDGLARERRERGRRREAMARDRADWTARRDGATARLADLAARRAETAAEQAALADVPARLAARRRQLFAALAAAETAANAAGDALAVAEHAKTAADAAARSAHDILAAARESLAREEARGEAADLRLQQAADHLAEVATAPGGAGSDDPTVPVERLAQTLESLKGDRERLGGVNLRAEDELGDIEASRDRLVAERDDLIAAIKHLRQAIQTLNREGRERLGAAFAAVDGHFRHLFATLFGGGEARLELIESEDPLEAGLEVIARPPGKRAQTLSLLSGGEQALTAMALIFAIFLTSPAPICVLDEVDAPLDDANVERFCNLLDVMRQETDTRFLVVTHNPVTMSRMDRLFGVTMAERGVSRLVSVDLGLATRLREAS